MGVRIGTTYSPTPPTPPTPLRSSGAWSGAVQMHEYPVITINAVSYYYGLLNPANKVDAENNATINVDSSTVTVSNDIVDSQRIHIYAVVPNNSIEYILNGIKTTVLVECGANMRCTHIDMRLVTINRTTGAVVVLSTLTRTFLGGLDSPTSRNALGFVFVPASINIDATTTVLAYEISVWGRQILANVIPAPLTLWHRRGLDDCGVDVDIIRRL